MGDFNAGEGEGAGAAQERVTLAPVTLPPDLLRRIAEDGRRESLAEEIGALRVVLARLLATTGDDPARLSQDVPRVVNAIVRAELGVGEGK